jgi:hypothetical protein
MYNHRFKILTRLETEVDGLQCNFYKAISLNNINTLNHSGYYMYHML